MVHITDRPGDPVAAFKMNDAYMRWALEAAEEVVGKDGLAVVLRQSGLERFVDNYPPDNLEPPGIGITFGDYANLNAGLLTFYGRPGKGMVMRIGRISSRKAIEHQSNIFNLSTVRAASLLPAATQVKLTLSAMLAGFKILYEKFGQEFKGEITDGGDYYIYSVETDPISAGKSADGPIGWLIEGTIEEAGRQIFGKFFDVTQVACRSMGAPASVWHVNKQPTEE
ncbi:MAG TPA: 4-vinyl reductase [Phototrophicaceae bacterium]|jgi:predicted hydrocarbon binding protein|nr:4-vinyl reductase [Phototrophicaceae bacterium]